MPITVFQDFDDILGGAVTTGAGKVVGNVLGGLAGDVTVLIALAIMLRGLAIAFQQYSFWRGVADLARMFAVAMLIGGGWYVTYFQTPVLVTFPNWIATLVSGGAATGPNAQGTQFDLVMSAALHILASVLAGASASPQWVAQVLISFAAVLCDGFFLGVVYAVWETAKVLAALVIIGGAFLAGFLLYDATRPVFYRFVDKLIGLLLLDAMMAALVQFILYANGTYVRHVQDVQAGLDVQVAILISMTLFAMMSAVVAVIVPAVAAYIGGGVGVDTRQIVNLALRQLQRTRALVVRSARAGSRAVQSTRAGLGRRA